MRKCVRIATHSSPMALKYADKVAEHIRQLKPTIAVEVVRVPTKADKYYYLTPPDIGGKCEFLEEVIDALNDGKADIAAHVIEENPRGKVNWPRGWLSVKCAEDEGEAIHLISDPSHIPNRFWESSS